MDNKLRILYVTSEIDPFLELTEIAKLIKNLPQSMQERGMEVRILMPKFGTINERKNRLHEVVRLSGINITVGDQEKPLIIKVASIQAAKLQVYFLDNEDYFNRKSVFTNKKGVFHEDNDERAIFFCKGVLETVKKLGWAPDIVHCTDWMTALIPLYLKTTYKNDPVFQNSKSVFTVYDNAFDHKFGADIISKAKMLDISDEMLASLSSADFLGFIKIGAEYADLVVNANENMDAEVSKVLDEVAQNKIDKNIDEENITDQFFDIYNELTA